MGFFFFVRSGYMYPNYIDKLNRQKEEIENMRQKYMQVSDALFNMFMVEYNNIGAMFKEQ